MPTYPTIITGITNVPFEQSRQGPFGYNNTRFLFGIESLSPFNLTCVKTEDNGDTWTECDAANSKPRGSTLPIVTCVEDSDYPTTPLIYVVTLDASNKFRLSQFNVSTETWGSDITSTLGYSAGLGPSVSGNAWNIAHRAADNKVVLFVASGIENVPPNRWRCQYALCDLGGASWSAYTTVGTSGGDNANYFSLGCESGGSGITHFMIGRVPASGSSSLIHVSLSSSNALSANQTLETPWLGQTYQRGSVSSRRVSGSDVYVHFPYRGKSGTTTTRRIAVALSALSPSWSIVVIESGIENTFNPKTTWSPITVCVDNGRLWAFWGRTEFNSGGSAIDADILRAQSDDGLTWSTPEVFYQAPGGTIGSSNMGCHSIGTLGLAALNTISGTDHLRYWEEETPAPPVIVEPLDVGCLYFSA